MRVQMVTDLFRYEPCELSIQGDMLELEVTEQTRSISFSVNRITDAALSRGTNGRYRLELATGSECFEFLLPDEQVCDEARELLSKLIRSSGRIELRMSND